MIERDASTWIAAGSRLPAAAGAAAAGRGAGDTAPHGGAGPDRRAVRDAPAGATVTARSRILARIGFGTLRLRVLWTLVLLAVVPLGVSAPFLYRHGEAALQARTLQHLETVARLRAAEIERLAEDRVQELAHLAAVPGVRRHVAALAADPGPSAAGTSGARAELRAALEQLRTSAGFAELFLLDPRDGRVLLSTDPGQEGKSRGDRRYFLEGRKAPFVQPPDYSPTLGKPAMVFAAPVVAPAGGLAGVLAGRADLGLLDRLAAAEPGLGASGRIVLVSRFNALVSESAGRGADRWRPVFTDGVRLALAGQTGTALYLDHEGRPVLGAYRWLPRLDLGLVAEMDRGEALAPVRRMRRDVLVTLAVVSALAATLALALADRITRPLTRFVETAAAIGRGDFTKRVGAEWPAELAALASAMNRMADDLLASRRELEHHNRTLESRIDERTWELSQLQDQLRQAQKMEAVGRLAGGIAHDFNNLLTAITGYGDLLMASLAPDDPRRADVEQIRKATDRAATLTKQLLAFGRRQVLQPRVLDLNAVVADMEKMLRRLIGEDIELVTVPGPGLWRVKADPGQLEQVLMNLAVNARDAMPHGGRLIIETANVELDEAYARRHVAVRPGPYVLLAVSDTGCGMDAETLGHVFEPFFTTKEPGKGTGLGLATVYGIVKQSGGNIWVYSEPGRGTTFKIYLPRVDAPLEAAGAAAAAASAAGPAGGRETLLLVEDDDGVRVLAREVLRRKGYRVLEARDGREALRRSETHDGPIALVVTDLVMPGLGGREVFARLAVRRPDLRVLYTSGYTDAAIFRQSVFEPGTAFISKPFTPDALARRVREVLDAPPPAPEPLAASAASPA